MRLVPRILFFLSLAWLAFVLYSEAQAYSKLENADPTRIILLFGGVVLVAIVVAAIGALWVVPAISERLTGAVYNPGEQVEANPHAEALGKVAAGDYEGAVADYQKVLKKNPEDALAVTEIVHLYCDKLHDYDSAATVLEEQLQKEWPPEHAGFLANRLVDVYWNYQRDAHRARQMLLQIVESMPGTKFAANANHRLREVDKAIGAGETGEQPPAG